MTDESVIPSTVRNNSAEKASNKIPVGCKDKNTFVPRFLTGVVVLTVLSLIYLNIDWLKLLSRVPDVGVVFWDLAHFDFSDMDIISVSYTHLMLWYILAAGIWAWKWQSTIRRKATKY